MKNKARKAALATAADAMEANHKRKITHRHFRYTYDQQQASWVFHEDILVRLIWAWQERNVGLVIPTFLGLDDVWVSATCYEDFLIKVSPLFSSKFITQMAARFQRFSSVCGKELTDAFIASRPVVMWAFWLVRKSILYYLGRRRDIDSSPLLDAQGSSTPTPQMPVKRVYIKGRTLLEAWKNSPEVREITGYEDQAPKGWSPSSLGTEAPVFFASHKPFGSSRYCKASKAAFDTVPSSFGPSFGTTQIYPAANHGWGFNTSFSAFWAFAFGMFMTEVIENPPERETARDNYHATFNMRGEDYCGVLLVRFGSQQPAPLGLTSFTVPQGVETAWGKTSHSHAYKPGGVSSWATAFKQHHGQTTSVFPDVVHMREQSWPMVESSCCNTDFLWNTAWTNHKAISAVNRQISDVWVISWEIGGRRGLDEVEVTPFQRRKKRVCSVLRKMKTKLLRNSVEKNT